MSAKWQRERRLVEAEREGRTVCPYRHKTSGEPETPA
jgi:hypothetical protein